MRPGARNRNTRERYGVMKKLFWYVIDSPFSRFTEAVRSLKVAVDLNGAIKENKVIGHHLVTSE